MSGVLDERWIGRLVEATADLPPRPGLDTRVALVVGDDRVVLDITDGRVTGAVDGEARIELPLTPEQLDAVAFGELSLAVAYMRGDVKPVGPSGALAVLLEVVEDPATWTAWRSSE